MPAWIRSLIIDLSNSAKTPHHLEQRLAARRRGVHTLLMQVQVDLQGVQLA
jgi:hypothetical protein